MLKIHYVTLLYIYMNEKFNYNTYKVDFEFFVYFIGPVVSIIAIMAAVILVHPEWVKKNQISSCG